MTEIVRASTMAIIEEDTVGTLKAPSAGSDYIPLRAGDTITADIERLESDEFLANLGATKSGAGKVNVTGEHPAYVKHSGSQATAPEVALFYKSALGAQEDAAAEYNTVASSTTSLIKVDTGEGATFSVGEGLLIKDLSGGYSVRNITSISSDDLSINFNLDTAPGTGVDLGQANLIKPAISGHPSISVWKENGDEGALEAVSGARTTSISMTLDAAGYAETSFSYAGTNYYWNPIEITASNRYIDFTDDLGTVAAALSLGWYRSPKALADEIATQMTAASVGSGNDTITCVFNSHGSNAGKFTISTDGTTLSLLFLTGANNANYCSVIGFDKADETGATSYNSDNAITYPIPGALTPSYDTAENIVMKQAELMIGDASDNICRKASALSFTIDSTTVDADSLCAETGLFERVPASRAVTMTATLILEKHEVGLFDKFFNNTTTQVMANMGQKDNSGNWTAGTVVNLFLGNAVVSGHAVTGDDYVQLDIEATAFVTSSKDDVYINFL